MPYTAIRPEATGFGQEQDAYLKSLMGKTGDTTADAINQINLMLKARQTGDGGYMQALREAQANQLEGSRNESQADVAKAYLPAAAPLAKEGVGGAVLPNANNPYLRIDPNRLTGSDALHQQNIQAGTVKDMSAGIKDLAESGMAPSPETVGSMITPYLQPEPTAVKPYLTPKSKTDEKNADSNRIKAEADMYDAKHGGQGRGGSKDKTVTTMIPDGHGGLVPIAVVQTSSGPQVVGTGGAAGNGTTPASPSGHWERDPTTNRAKWVPQGKK